MQVILVALFPLLYPVTTEKGWVHQGFGNLQPTRLKLTQQLITEGDRVLVRHITFKNQRVRGADSKCVLKSRTQVSREANVMEATT